MKTGKLLIVFGMILVALGIVTLVFGGFPEERHAFEIGDLSLGVTETARVPEWAAWTGIVVGALLATFGFTKKD